MASTPGPTPALWQFLGAYLHQDWPIEFDDEWAALDRFVGDSPDLARRLPLEIGRLLVEHHSEPDLRALLVAEGCNYAPSRETGGYRAWLTEIARRVTAALPQSNPT